MEFGVGLVKVIWLLSGEVYIVIFVCESVMVYWGKDDICVEGGGGLVIDWFYYEIGVKYSY